MTENHDLDGQGAVEADRTEQEALDLLRGEGNSGPLRPLDEVARRRFVDSVLAADEIRSQSRRTGGPRRIAIAAAASLAAAVAVVVGILFAVPDGSLAPPASAPPAPLEQARVLLVSGTAGAPGDRVRPGDGIGPGTRLASGPGEIWLDLPDGFTAALLPGTRIEVTRLDRDGLVLAFEGGELLVSSLPGRRGPLLLVATREGDVTVKGTVLRIDDRSGSVEVVVARGLVEIDSGPGRTRFDLGPSEAVTLDGARPRPTLQEEDAVLLGQASAFDLLDARSRSAVELRSAPPGAEVRIDGLRFGTTPLSAAVRPGHRRLEVFLAGHHEVSEIISLEPDSDLHRYFELREAVRDPAEAGERTAGESALSRGGTGSPRGPEARELLREAQDRRASRDFPGSARAYEKLLQFHPSSDEARAALVSLGQLEVDRLGRPAAALRRFEAYLRAGSQAPLRAEALLGRARSLRALGRVAEERETLERFLAEHAGAIQSPAVERRIREIRDAAAAPAGGQ
jgi:TolA-binding protein